MSPTLPLFVCTKCEKDAASAVLFIKLCKESARRWTQLSDSLSDFQCQMKRNMYFLIEGDKVRTFPDYGYKTPVSRKQRVEKFRKRLNRKKLNTERAFDAKAQCPECRKKFDQIYKLNKHMHIILRKMCTYCKQIVHVRDFGSHLRLHNATAYTCTICLKSFENLIYYERHTLVCRRRQYECVQCCQSFQSELKLKLHLPVHNMKTCPICNTVISNQSCYRYHAKRCNAKSRPKGFPSGVYTCHHCSKDYKTKEVLRAHIHHAHMYGRQYQCDKCGKKFLNKQHLAEHENSHNKILDRFVCNVCNAKFSTRRGYGKHVTNKGHIGGLKDHAVKLVGNTREGGKRELRELGCAICSQSFMYKKSLKKHLLTKHNIQNWQIVVCDENVRS